jgi:hypothetical protein
MEANLISFCIVTFLLLCKKSKGCKPKCRFSQVIILGKYEVDPQEMVDTK